MKNQTALMMAMAAMMAGSNVNAKNSHVAVTLGEVTICLSKTFNTKTSDLLGARMTAEKIFAQIGVVLHWTDMKNCPAGGLGIQFRPATSEDEHPGAIGFAYPYAQDGVKIVVLTDRVKELAYGRESSTFAIFGHVLAHEIGHVLLATDAHSEDGLMKAHWTNDQIAGMRRDLLGFTSMETRMIQENLTASTLRASR